MSLITSASEWLLRRSAVWGGMASFAFYVLVVQRLESDALLARYFTGDAGGMKLLTAVLFFIAGASLVMKLLRLSLQYGSLDRPLLPTDFAGERQQIEQALADLNAAPSALREGYLIRRLCAALETLKHAVGGDLESNLRRLEQDDRQSMADSFALVRSLTAGILVCGSISLVAGASAALYDLSPSAVQHTLPAATTSVVGALDAFAQALALAALVAFGQLGVQRVEVGLLNAVDRIVARELGRCQTHHVGGDGAIPSLIPACEKAVQTIEAAITRHDASLSRVLTAAGRKWEETASAAAVMLNRTVGEALAAGLKEHAASLNSGVAKLTSDLQTTLVRHAEILGENIDNHTGALAESLDHHTGALAEALEHHAAVLTETEKKLASENQTRVTELAAVLRDAMEQSAARQEKLTAQSESFLQQAKLTLVDAAEATVTQQAELNKQAEVLLQVVEATGQIRELEVALNENLAAVSASQSLEQTIVSLAAAIQLLNSKLKSPAAIRGDIRLGDDPMSQAA